MTDASGQDRIDPNALTPEQVAKVLSAYGEPVPVEWVLQDIEEGCPTNPDGTVHLMTYTAWLTRELVRREFGSSSSSPD